MRGWVEKRGEKYRAVVLLDDGSKRTKTLPGKRDADRWRRQTMTDLERGKRIARRSGATVSALIDAFVADSIDVREKTAKRNTGLLRNHVEPAFGDKRAADVTRKHVQALVTGLTRSGYAADTVRKVLELCQRIFAEAVREGMIMSSPCFDIRKPRLEEPEGRFLTPAELAILAGAIEARYRALVLTAGYGGLRIGELAALQTSSVDLARGAITVRQSAVETSEGISNGPVKTRAGLRRVPIPQQLVDELEEHLGQFSDPDEGWVFTADHRGQLRPHNFRARAFKAAVGACGLAPLRPHDLRHTAASIWIAAGVSQKEITARLGHSSIVMTNRYGHLFPESDEVFARRVSSAFVSPKEGD